VSVPLTFSATIPPVAPFHARAVIVPPEATVTALYCGTRTSCDEPLYVWCSVHPPASVMTFPETEPTVTNS
jgi:hypothetical protein